MEEFICKRISPLISLTNKVLAETMEEAANEFQFQTATCENSYFIRAEGKETEYISMVEVCSNNQTKLFLARRLHSGIGRKGGIKRKFEFECNSYKDIADSMKISLSSITDGDWIGEEKLT